MRLTSRREAIPMGNMRMNRIVSDFRAFADALEREPTTRSSFSCHEMCVALDAAHTQVLSLLPHLFMSRRSEPAEQPSSKRRRMVERHPIGLLSMSDVLQEQILKELTPLALCKLEQAITTPKERHCAEGSFAGVFKVSRTPDNIATSRAMAIARALCCVASPVPAVHRLSILACSTAGAGEVGERSRKRPSVAPRGGGGMRQ